MTSYPISIALVSSLIYVSILGEPVPAGFSEKQALSQAQKQTSFVLIADLKEIILLGNDAPSVWRKLEPNTDLMI